MIPISPKDELTTAPLREAGIDRQTAMAVVVEKDDDEMADELFGGSDGEDEVKTTPPTPSNEPRLRRPSHIGADPTTLGPDEGRVPASLKSPIKPSAVDIASHYLNHLPFRDWCPICQTSKMKEDPTNKSKHPQKRRIAKVGCRQSVWTTRSLIE